MGWRWERVSTVHPSSQLKARADAKAEPSGMPVWPSGGSCSALSKQRDLDVHRLPRGTVLPSKVSNFRNPQPSISKQCPVAGDMLPVPYRVPCTLPESLLCIPSVGAEKLGLSERT